MDLQNREQTGEVKSARAKVQWIPPEVERLVAGAAEGSADITSDGPSMPS